MPGLFLYISEINCLSVSFPSAKEKRHFCVQVARDERTTRAPRHYCYLSILTSNVTRLIPNPREEPRSQSSRVIAVYLCLCWYHRCLETCSRNEMRERHLTCEIPCENQDFLGLYGHRYSPDQLGSHGYLGNLSNLVTDFRRYPTGFNNYLLA